MSGLDGLGWPNPEDEPKREEAKPVWFKHEPERKGYYWVYIIGDKEDVPQVLYWDGYVFQTHFKWDRTLCYNEKWSCAGPIRPPKIPKQSAVSHPP